MTLRRDCGRKCWLWGGLGEKRRHWIHGDGYQDQAHIWRKLQGAGRGERGWEETFFMRMGNKELKWGHQNWGEWLLLLALCQRQDCKPLEFTFVLYSTQTIIREMREHLATPLSLTTNKWISMEAAD